jgi:transposase
LTHVEHTDPLSDERENGVIDMAILSIIRRRQYRDHVSLREIAKRLGVSRNTVRRYIRAGTILPTYPERLNTEAKRPRKQRRTLKQIHADLSALGFTGPYDRVAAFARRWAVEKVRRGKLRDVNARFSAMVSHYLFDAEFCKPASGWEKGQIEKNVQDSRHRLWQRVPAFGSLAALNDWLADQCVLLWQQTKHPEQDTTGRLVDRASSSHAGGADV